MYRKTHSENDVFYISDSWSLSSETNILYCSREIITACVTLHLILYLPVHLKLFYQHILACFLENWNIPPAAPRVSN